MIWTPFTLADQAGNPELYNPADPIKFLIESGGQFEDLPRDPINHVAIIGDPRNDENMIIAGLHAAFLLFHNHAVDLIRTQYPGIPDNDAYLQAQRLTVWHYEWMILHEFLPHVVPQSVIDDVLTNGRHFYNPLHNEAFIPVEFQITYRFGHSMVRPSYRANLHGDNGQPFFGMIFDPAGEGSPDPRGPAWRRQSSKALYRLADVLRLRRCLQCRCTAQQKNRHNSFDATLPPSVGDDIHGDAAGLADATQFIKVSDLVAPLRSAHRK